MSCAEVEELAGAFALEAVPDDEADAVLDHLATCPAVHTLISQLVEVAHVLPLAVDEVEPPAALRERLLAAARTADGSGHAEPLPFPDRPETSEPLESRQNGVRTGAAPAGEAPAETVSQPVVMRPPSGRERRAWQTPTALLAAAAMLALAVGLGVWNLDLHHQLDDRASAQQLQERVLAAVASGAKVTPLSSDRGISGDLVVPADGGAPYIVAQMPALAGDKSYEAWIIRDGRPVAAGLFHRSGLVVLPLDGSIAGAQAVAVTLETKVGVSQPTGAPIVQAKLS